MTGYRKILLALLPFWSPLAPPMGIASLKTYGEARGFDITACDANIEPRFGETREHYSRVLEQALPEAVRGNFRNTSGRVLRQHLWAHLNRERRPAYKKFVSSVIEAHFFTTVDEPVIDTLDECIAEFYRRLETYLVDLIEREQPDLLGLSLYGDTAPASLFAAGVAKRVKPGITVLAGGGIFTEDLAPGSPNYDDFLENTPDIDKVIVGEGEELFARFLEGGLPGGRRVYTLKDTGGEPLDLGRITVPDLSDFQLSYYPYLATFTSRSCPFRCSFCSESNYWGPFRKRDPRDAAKEMIALYRASGRQLFLLCDSLLNPVITPLADELRKSEISIYWDGYLRADRAVCSMDNTMNWRRGGFYRARLGLESGSGRLLEIMGKRITPVQMKEAVTALAAAGIKTTTYWVIGHPGETEEDFRATLDFISEMRDHIYEADCGSFSYFPRGQVKSREWLEGARPRLLYPEWPGVSAMPRTWYLDVEPRRRKVHERVNRFMDHCRDLGVPNPYSLKEIYEADERWKRLQRSAVPSLVEFREGGVYIDENKHLRDAVRGKNIAPEELEWDF